MRLWKASRILPLVVFFVCTFVLTLALRYSNTRRRATRRWPNKVGYATSSNSSNRKDAKGNPAHFLNPNGLLEVNPKARHPIHDLIANAQRKWDDKLASQSQSLSHAVTEYKRRYGRPPPRGFDLWWKFVVVNNIQLPDEYDQINRDIEPFFGVAPSDLQWLQDEFSRTLGTFTLESRDGKTLISKLSFSNEDMRMGTIRAEERLELLQDVEQWLPNFNATYSAHDSPTLMVQYELIERLHEAAKEKGYVDIEVPIDDDNLGYATACPPNSPYRLSITSKTLKHPTYATIHTPHKSFISSHVTAFDPCQHPSHTSLSGLLIAHSPQPKRYMTPTFSMSSTPLHADIISPTLEHFRLPPDAVDTIPWKDKQDDRLVWRGLSTGLYARPQDVPWRNAQRQRLVDLLQTGNVLTDQRMMYVLDPSLGEEKGEAVSWAKLERASELNQDLMDVALANQPVQCEGIVCDEMLESLRFVEPMGAAESFNYRYVLDVDGNGWSARFKKLMNSHAVVLKSTIYPEWFSDRIAPWVHYVPVKIDYSDIYDIMAFLRGLPVKSKSQNHDSERRGAHPELAEAIAKAGTSWSQTFWRREDMAAYTFRLMLEYARVMADNRAGMDFEYDERLHGDLYHPYTD